MMLKPSMAQLAIHDESYYSVVAGIAKRAREITEEEERDHIVSDEKPVKKAVDEFYERKYTIVEDPSVKTGKSTESTI